MNSNLTLNLKFLFLIWSKNNFRFHIMVILRKGAPFSRHLVWLLGAYSLLKLFELNICLEESTTCNYHGKLQYFFWNIAPAVLRYCNETNIRGTWFADLCCFCGCQKVPFYFICTVHPFMLYSKCKELNRKFLQNNKLNTKPFLSAMQLIL
jgi:hypothetical protein